MSIFASVVLAASVALSPSPSPSPAATPDPFLDYEVGASHETLTNSYPSWDTQYMRVTKKTADNQTFYGQFETTGRFNKQDDQLTIGMYLPVSDRWMFLGEGTASNTHNILPSYSVLAGLQYNSGGHWYESLSAQHKEYDTAVVNSAILSVEHYWDRYRIYYALTAANLAGTGTDVEHTIRFDTYYGKQQGNFIGIGYTTGREVENVGLPALLTSRVDGWNILGRHWVNDRWAIIYGLGTFTQGTSYTRAGGHLGIDYRF